MKTTGFVIIVALVGTLIVLSNVLPLAHALTFSRENITTANQNATNNNTEILAKLAFQQAGLLPYDDELDVLEK
ncbi:MAG: hypothetical protein GEU26_09925 [Nitrososphaeraceae archaeon]|nr:hypothetical protein [Nitrososphaeraceae archaeon]